MLKSIVIMKRDMDLIRKLLLAVEAGEYGYSPDLEIEGYTQEEIGYHSYLLGEAGLVKTINTTTLSSSSPSAKILNLTWEGHEFLDAARENNTWNQAKDKISKIGGASIQIWAALLTEIAKNKLGL